MDIGELTALPAFREQGTNLHHGLLLAGRFFRQHPSMQPVLLVVTDGEPTAHLLADGDSWFNYPPDAETIRVTVAELDRLGRRGAGDVLPAGPRPGAGALHPEAGPADRRPGGGARHRGPGRRRRRGVPRDFRGQAFGEDDWAT